METIIHLLAFVLPIIALSGVVLTVCGNLYFTIRRKFPVKVNCWFCNQWTKVHYDNCNSFDCPTCLQYNGFTSDGDYNKPIPAQRNELLNRSLPVSKSRSRAFSNGLCHLCNYNQQLRIFQLANFVPLDEPNYDTEIEHFRKQLDKAYRLCTECDKVVKTTLRKQNCLLGLKFFQLRKKGLLLDLNKSHDGLSRKDKRMIVESSMRAILVSFLLLHLVCVVVLLDFSGVDFEKVIPESLLVHARNLRKCLINNDAFNYASSTYDDLNLIFEEFSLPYLNAAWIYFDASYLSAITVDNLTFMTFVACLLQFIALTWSFPKNLKKNFWQLILWILLAIIDWKYPTNHSKFATALQITAIIVIVLLTYLSDSPKIMKKKKPKCTPKKSSTKIYAEDISDSEEFETSISSTKSKCIFPSNGTFENPKPFCDNSSIFTVNDSLNKSFAMSKNCFNDTASVAFAANKRDDNSSSTAIVNDDFDIGISLNKLHLNNPSINKRVTPNSYYVNSTVGRPKPVISPAKFRNASQNSCFVGGFWRDSNGILMPNSNYQHISRSSSQTSGFVSQPSTTDPHYLGSLPSSPNNLFYGDLECSTAYLEPAYNTNLIHRRNMNSYCPKFPCENYHLNREQLVYATPNLIRPCRSFYDYFLCKNNFSPNSCKENGLKCSVCNDNHYGGNEQ